MTEKTYTCIVCPKSCRVVLIDDGDKRSVTGNGCKRGEAYALNEYENPMRMVTTTVRVTGGEPGLLPVISRGEVPKARLMACMAELYAAAACAPVKQGDVVVGNILGLGVDIIASRDIKKRTQKEETV